jgi:ATP-dependent Clp protease ATP-binding subunit ClpA
VLDESCSKVKLRGFKVPENIVGTEIRCGKLEQEKEAALKAGDIEKASELHREQKEAEKKLEQAKKRFNKKNEKKKRSAQKTIYKFYCWLENASLVCSIKRQILTEYKREG